MSVLDELKQIQKEIAILNKRAAELLDLLPDSSVPAPVHTSAGSLPKIELKMEPMLPGFSPHPEEEESSLSLDSPIIIYTDGACSGNPGPAGSGVVVIQNDIIIHEISEHLGLATNNIAELTAIKLGIEFVKDHCKTPITLYTDSRYAIGILTMNWKAKANVELVDSIKKIMGTFDQLQIKHIKGHSGHPGNERADILAVRGSKPAPSRRWEEEVI